MLNCPIVFLATIGSPLRMRRRPLFRRENADSLSSSSPYNVLEKYTDANRLEAKKDFIDDMTIDLDRQRPSAVDELIGKGGWDGVVGARASECMSERASERLSE